MSDQAVSSEAAPRTRVADELGRAGALLASSRSVQLCLLLVLVSVFLIFRWLQRLEPWNSDDMELFQFSADAAAGKHWIFGSELGSAAAGGGRLPHTAFRIGLLPATVPVIWSMGASATAYYLVPLAFSLFGFLVLYWLMRRNFGASVALVFATIHVAWPFELQHASVLLTDLPAAALGVTSLCLLDASAGRSLRGRLGCALLVGLAGFETYLLRNNGLVLLAPAFLVFLWSRRTRLQTLYAGGVIVLGVFAQQAFLVHRGFSWGYDWSSVRADFAEYSQFLPVYSWPQFLVRQFSYQLNTFGRGLTGILAAALMAGSLLLHLALLRWERRPLLLSLAVFGLFSWLVFSFSIYERMPGGVRAMVPVNYRFIQPFTYSSLMVLAWAWSVLPVHLSKFLGGLRQRWLSALPKPLLRAALPLLLLGFSIAASTLHARATYRQGETRRLVEAIEEQRSRLGAPLSVAGTESSLQVPRMFLADSTPAIEWRALSAHGLAEWVQHAPPGLVLREFEWPRYVEPETRASYRADLANLEAALWNGYAFAYVDTKYGLFRTPEPAELPVAELEHSAANLPVSEPSSLPLLGAPRCALQGGDSSRTLLPAAQTRGRTSCEFAWPADAIELATLNVSERSSLVLRVSAAYELPLSLSVDVVQTGEHGMQRKRSTLAPGTSHIPVQIEAGSRSLFVVYRLSTRSARVGPRAEAIQGVTIVPARWRALSAVPTGAR